uniref:Uncharacterized protein n=1 Tax=Trepomonas sp. PC1 TaxID=1076344 RepID=A0A146KJZ3_9EUKA|eukprot:JAP96144.1 hypothetical protein TPC1_10619 [Trepomonas sp. PC1]
MSTILEQIIKLVPPLPIEPELQPGTTYSDQLASKQQLQRLSGFVMGSFPNNCQIKHFNTLASRVIAPYQTHAIAMTDTCRRVVWSFDQKRISPLDFVSFGFIIFLGSLSTNESHKQQFDYESILEPINSFTQSRSEQLNGLLNSILALKTEIGTRRFQQTYKQVFQLLTAAETVMQIRKMELNSTEELVFESVSQRACQVAQTLFDECFGQLEEHNANLHEMWLSQKEYESQFLLIAVCASTILIQLQNYVDKITEVCQLQRQKEIQQQKDQKQEKEILKKLQESTQKVSANKTQKVYRKFRDLSQQEQYEVKFRATDSLFNYILLKKNLGLSEDQKLFEDQNDEFYQQKELKKTQLEQFLAFQQKLTKVKEAADSLMLSSKVDDICSLGVFTAGYQHNQKVLVKTPMEAKKVPQIMAVDIYTYRTEIQKTLYFAISQQFGSWTCLRKALLVLIHARACYSQRMFAIKDFFDIVGFQQPEEQQSIGLSAEQELYKQEQLKKAAKMENELMKNQILKQQEQLEQKILTENKIKAQRYTVSKMRLIIDHSVIGQCHDLFSFFVRWLSSFSKQVYPDQTSRQVVELRNFCVLVSQKFVNGGDDLNYIPYLEDFSVIFDLFSQENVMKTFTSDELVGFIVTFWAFSFNLDLFQIIKMCLKKAVGCNQVILQTLKQVLGDLYIYLDATGEELELAAALFESE